MNPARDNCITYAQLIESTCLAKPIDRYEIDEHGVVWLFSGNEWRGWTNQKVLRWMLDNNLSSTGQIGGSKGS